MSVDMGGTDKLTQGVILSEAKNLILICPCFSAGSILKQVQDKIEPAEVP